jgi:hypothetical protein
MNILRDDVLAGDNQIVTGYKKTEDVALSEQLLDEYSGGKRASWAEQAKQDDDFRHGNQWTDEAKRVLEGRDQSPIVVNVIQPAVEFAVAALTTNKPRFTSTGREDSDTRTGKVFSDLLTYVWDISNGNMELKQTIDDYYVKGMGLQLAYVDPYADMGKGEVKITSIDPLDVYIDPNSKDRLCQDAAHILIVKKLTKELILRCYPLMRGKLKLAVQSEEDRTPTTNRVGLTSEEIDVTDSYHEHYEVIDRYSKIKLERYKVYDTSADKEYLFNDAEFKEFLQKPAFILLSEFGEPQYVTTGTAVEEAVQMFEQTGGIYHQVIDEASQQPMIVPGEADENAIPNSEVVMKPVTMADLVQEGIILYALVLTDRVKRVMSIGGYELYNHIMEIEDYPVVPFMNRHRRNPFPMSDVRFVRPIQEYVNKIRSLIIAHASSSTNVKLLIPRGAVNKSEVEQNWAKAGTGVIEFDAEIGTPIIVGPVPLPNELYKNEADARKDIQEILGVYTTMYGDPSSAPDTYKGTVALDEYGQRRIKSKQDDIEQALNQLAKVVVQLIQITYTEQKVVRLLRPNNAPMEIAINIPIYDDITGNVKDIINDVTVGKYDVVVVSGSMLPSNRWAQFEYYMQMYERGLIDQIEVLKKTELVDIEGVLNRHNIILQMQQQIQSMADEIKTLEGDLQTAERESVNDRKRLEVEKFKARLSSMSSRAEAAVQMYQKELDMEVKMTRQEIKSGNTKK